MRNKWIIHIPITCQSDRSYLELFTHAITMGAAWADSKLACSGNRRKRRIGRAPSILQRPPFSLDDPNVMILSHKDNKLATFRGQTTHFSQILAIFGAQMWIFIYWKTRKTYFLFICHRNTQTIYSVTLVTRRPHGLRCLVTLVRHFHIFLTWMSVFSSYQFYIRQSRTNTLGLHTRVFKRFVAITMTEMR